MPMVVTLPGEAATREVAVVGAGLLGRGIASVIARHGIGVVLHDASVASLRGAEQLVRAQARAGTSVRADCTLESAIARAEIVIEAVVEDLDVKQQLFKRIGEANSEAILMSNSSALPIGQIGLTTPRPERTVGTHWWNPPQLIPVVEVIQGPHTSEHVITRTMAFLTQLGKQPVRVGRDVPGFIGNRLQHALWREAIGLVSEGALEATAVDNLIAQTLGLSLAKRGPMAEMAHLGRERVRQMFAEALPRMINERAPSPLLRAKVAAGELGAKSGRGFLTWPPGAREQRAARLERHVSARLQRRIPDDDTAAAAGGFPGTGSFPGAGDVASAGDHGALEKFVTRLYVALWREAAALVEQDICRAVDVDLMACNTIGLRLAAMAPLENADFVGLDLTLAIHSIILPSLNVSTELPSWCAQLPLDAARPS